MSGIVEKLTTEGAAGEADGMSMVAPSPGVYYFDR